MKVKINKSLNQNDKFPIAVRHYEAGDYKGAVKILEGMIKSNPRDFDALVFLGGINLSSGNYEKSVEYFQRVISIRNNHPIAHYNLGLSYQGLKQYDKAEENYKKALQINPKNIDAINNLGVVCFQLGRMDEALEYYNRILQTDSNNAKVLNNMGNLESSKGNYSLAETYYLKALSSEPGNSSYLFNLADCLIKQEMFPDAVEILNKIINAEPNNFQAYNSLGVVYLKQKEYKKADELFEKSIQLKEDYWEAYQNLGFCYERLNMNAEAIETYRHVLDLNKNSADAMIKLSGMYIEEGKYSDSEKYLNRLSENKDAKILSYTNLGVSKLKQGNIDEAIHYTSKALKENDQVAITHYNYAHALLLKGDFEEGWKEYEWRKKRDDFETRIFSKPELIDTNVEGKKILVHDEQGLGDSIQFVRFLPKLKELGAHVILECNKRLAGMYKNLEGADQIIIKNGTEEPKIDYDYHIALLSLPLYFKADLTNIPCNIPYLFTDKQLVDYWQTIVDDNYLKVGISWAGNPKNYNDRNRSCRLKDLESLFDIPKVKFYSLQKGDAVKQIYELGSNKVVDLDALMDTMDTTAAAIDNFDLVISVDTAMAHLAGALGKKVWVMLSFLPDWRWMLNRTDSPWYPTVKLFRQTKEKNWINVVEEIRTELMSLVKNKFGENALLDSDTGIGTDNKFRNTLYLGLTKGENFGWGVCSKYLKKELSKKIQIDDAENIKSVENIADGDVFHALTNIEFESITNVRGKRNFGYTFFENELVDKSVENSKKYDIIFGGSTWCKEKMENKGIKNAGVLIQGVDPELFYPLEYQRKDNLFVIFSGGKFELRKGQDLVIKAFEILHKKYPDIILINAWYNFWQSSIATMAHSRHIKFEAKGNSWQEFISNILSINNIDLKRVFTLPVTPNDKLRELYSKTDIGLFPNRCEGGTNLVLMEYMACAKPVIASYNSGHKDVLTQNNSIMLKEMKKFELRSGNTLIADWEEASLEEIITSIEAAYNNRNQLRIIGKNAGDDLKNFTWEKTAESLLNQIIKGKD